MSFRIQRGLQWLAKAFGEDKASASGPPATILDTINPVVEAIGWSRIQDIDSVEVSATGAVAFVDGPTVPVGECWIVHKADVRTDTVGGSVMWITYANVIGKAIAAIPGSGAFSCNLMTAASSAAANAPRAIDRPCLLPAGNRLIAINSTNLGADTLSMRIVFSRIAVDEAIPNHPAF